MRIARVVALSAVVVAVPSGDRAFAQETLAPPGNSGVEQYLETVPTARGNALPQVRNPSPPPIPVAARRHLARQPTGRKLLDLVSKTAPRRAAAQRRRPTRPMRPEARLPKLVTPTVTAGKRGSSELFLPLALLATSVFLFGAAVRGRRR